jgi:hypothetical protein
MMGCPHIEGLELHDDIERRLEVKPQARVQVQKAYGIYEKAVKRQNEKIKRTLKVSVGDLVMAKQEPQSGRIGKLDSRFTGPWRVEKQADGN